MNYLTLHEFTSGYVNKRPHVPFRAAHEGMTITKLSKEKQIDYSWAIGTRCSKGVSTSLSHVNAYRLDLLIWFFDGQLNDAGMALKDKVIL